MWTACILTTAVLAEMLAPWTVVDVLCGLLAGDGCDLSVAGFHDSGVSASALESMQGQHCQGGRKRRTAERAVQRAYLPLVC